MLASVGLLSIATLTHRFWLPRACDQPSIQIASRALGRTIEIDICSTPLRELPRACDLSAVKNASSALSQFIKVDLCNTSFAGHASELDNTALAKQGTQLSDASPALAVVKHSHEIGERIQDLVDSYHDTSILPAVEARIRKSPLQWAQLGGVAQFVDQPKRDLQAAMAHNLIKYGDMVQAELRPTVRSTKWEFSELGAIIDRMTRNAQNHETRYCAFFKSWIPDSLLGNWLPRSYSAVILREELEKSIVVLIPQLSALHQSSDRLHRELERLTGRLRDLERELELQDTDDALRGEVESHISDLARLAAITSAIRTQTMELGRAFLLLQNMVETHLCLGFSPADGELVNWGLARLQASMDVITASRM